MNTNKKIYRIISTLFFVFTIISSQNSFSSNFADNMMEETIIEITDTRKKQETLEFKSAGDQIVTLENHLRKDVTMGSAIFSDDTTIMSLVITRGYGECSTIKAGGFCSFIVSATEKKSSSTENVNSYDGVIRVKYKTDGEPPRNILFKIKVDYVKEKSETQPLLAILTGGITGTVFAGTSLIAGKFNEELAPVVVGAALSGNEKFDKEVVSYDSKFYSDAILNAIAIHFAVALITCRGDLQYIAWCVPFKVITGTAGSLSASYITKTEIFNDVASDSLPYTNSLATSALIREGTRFLVKFNDREQFIAGWISDVAVGVTMDSIATATTNGDSAWSKAYITRRITEQGACDSKACVCGDKSPDNYYAEESNLICVIHKHSFN